MHVKETRDMMDQKLLTFFGVFKTKKREEGGQNNKNRPINLPKVISFSSDYKYTT